MTRVTWSRTATLILVLALGVSAIVKLHYLQRYRAVDPLADAPYGDSLVYLDEAQRHFVDGSSEAFYKPPLYSALLAALDAGTPDGRQRVREVQLACGLALLACLFLLAHARGGYLAGALSVAAAMAYAPLTFYETKLLDTTLAMTLAAIGLVALDGAFRRMSWSSSLLAGVLLGLSGITWAGNIVLIAALAIGMVFVRRRRLALSLVGGAAMVIMPVLVYNLRAGDLPFVAYSDAYAFLAGNNPNARGIFSLPPGYPDGVVNEREVGRDRAARVLGREPTPDEQRTATYAEGFDYVSSNPKLAILLLGAKLRFLVSSREIGDNDLLPREQGRFGLLAYQRLPFAILLVLGLFGLSVAMARPRLVVVAPVAVGIALVLLTTVSSRYRLPIAPYLAVGAGVGATLVVGRLRSSDRGAIPWTAVVIAVSPIVIATTIQLPYSAADLNASESLFDVILDAHAANVAEASGNSSHAASILARSVAEHPDEPAAAASLHVWLRAHPMPDRLTLADEATQAAPDDPGVRSVVRDALHPP